MDPGRAIAIPLYPRADGAEGDRGQWTSWEGGPCGGRLRVIATVQDPAVVHTVLAHLALSGAADPLGRPRPRPPP